MSGRPSTRWLRAIGALSVEAITRRLARRAARRARWEALGIDDPRHILIDIRRDREMEDILAKKLAKRGAS